MGHDAEHLERVRAQYDTAPYPRIPLHHAHSEDTAMLYLHNLMTPYYLRNQRVVSGAGKRILDAGCGSGFTSLALAQANPGARIVGIDLSERSVAVARERLAFHGFKSAEFHALPIERVGELGEDFDLINCDEVLYLLPDPGVGLAALTGALAPDGILRANLHSAYARAPVFRAQKFFQTLGLAGHRDEAEEIALARQTMERMNDGAQLKKDAWTPFASLHDDSEWYRMNYLLVGDKGFTIPETFAMLADCGLELVNMLLWPTWELRHWFKSGQPPPLVAAQIGKLTTAERLHLSELIHSSHRLIDFWCGHAGQSRHRDPMETWDAGDFAASVLHLHPQLATERLKQFLLDCLEAGEPFNFNQHMRVPYGDPIVIDGMEAALLPLWDGPQPYAEFERHWVRLAVRRTTVARPVFEHTARGELRRFVRRMESLAYLMVEPVG
ncbi:class I SAM-dependent methyltransferase [Gloeobacter violaceus]|uniref:Glr1518 protein n=1 Tax=Gloeobacter violaceus (strain ATCC 29082 / PCC 7421) TaxID=251221 RepID=Q7NKG0_GLOVI|nr:class I SAM-dependent methyltransferase [Gloeobacter violaceus]BAC89459.1 glr1518 [Gloeobacter violaceus PCC 7421]